LKTDSQYTLSSTFRLTVRPIAFFKNKVRRHFHYWVSIALVLALIPLLRRLHLPTHFDWVRLIPAFWLVMAAQSIFVAALLCVVEFPPTKIWAPFFQQFQREKLRLAALVIFTLTLLWKVTWPQALIVTVDTVAVLECWTRLAPKDRKRGATAILIPSLYLFGGFLLVFAYNDIILSVRFFAAYDPAFGAIDKWLLHGSSVARLSHWATRVFPVYFFRFLEFIYFGMFAQVGAALVLSGLAHGRREGLKFVGAILTAYYLALLLFFFWPSQGPYYLSVTHVPEALQTYVIQKQSIANSQALWAHANLARISTDYYIAFPCMHIAQPLIVIWFLRRWKRMITIMLVYDVLLVATILLLEWHYVIDIIAGGLVAALAVAAVDMDEVWRWIVRRNTMRLERSEGPLYETHDSAKSST